MNYKEMAKALVDTHLLEDIAGDGDGAPQSPPGERRSMAITDILTHSQIREVERIFKKAGDPDKALPQLKAYLRTLEVQLEGKGVVPDYLAYVLYARVSGII